MADRYWVGGSGTWDESRTTNWSDTSGGASGASAPTSADNVFFDSASASGDYTVSTLGTPVCANISVAKAAAGTLTVTGASGINVYGSWTSTAAGVTFGMPVSFLSTSAQTITTNGLTMAGGITVNGAGGSLQLQDNVTIASGAYLTLIAGTLDLNGFNITCYFVASNGTTARAIAFGTGGTITCAYATGGLVWSAADCTNFSYTGTGSVNFTYAGGVGTRQLQHGSSAGGSEATKAPPFNISAGTDIVQASGHFSDINTTGFSGTFGGATRTVYGNLTIAATTSTQASNSVNTFAGASGTKTITTNGVTLNFPITFNGAGSTFQLADNLTGGPLSTQLMTLTAGTVDLNGKTLSIFSVSATGSGVRGIVGNGGSINLFGSGTTIWNGAVATNATFNGVTLNCTYAGSTGSRGVALGTLSESNSISVNVTAGSDSYTQSGAGRNLNFTGFSGLLLASSRTLYGNLTFSSTMTATASSGVTTILASTSGTKTITTNGLSVVNSFTINSVGGGGTYQLVDNFNMYSAGVGTLFTLTAGTLDLNNNTLTAGFMSSSGSGVRSIAFGTSGSINLAYFGTTMWNAATATNFTYTGSGNVTLSNAASAGNRTLVHGSTAGVFPTNLPPTFNIVAGTDNVITTATGNFNNINFTGFSGNLINAARNIYGNLIFSPTMNLAVGASATNFIAPSNTQIFDTANLTIRNPITIGNSTSNGTVVLANALTTTNANLLTVTGGTLNANSQNISVAGFVSTGNAVRAVNISNTTIELTGTGNLWNVVTSTNLTLNSSNSTIIANNSSGNPTLYLGNGLVYDNIVISGTGGATIYPTGNITINTLSSTKTGPQDLMFNGNVNNYTTINNWNIVGDSSNTVFLTSDSSTPFNIVYGGNSNVNVSYYTIAFSNASPDNSWYALYTNNNANGGNNTGWIFELPATSSNFFLVF